MRLSQLLQCNSLGFILVGALFFTVFHNALFLHSAWSSITFNNVHSLIFAATLPVVIFCALNIIFSVLTIPFLRKPLAILLLLISAVTNDFIFSYGVVNDGNMIQRVFETNAQETMALLTPRMGLWLLLLGVIPSVFVCFLQINKTRPWWYMISLRAANVMLSAVLILLVAAFFYKDYTSLIRNNKSVLKMLTPLNVVVGTFKLAEHRYLNQSLPLVRTGENTRPEPVIINQPKLTRPEYPVKLP